MTSDIVKEAKEAVEKGLPCGFLVPKLLEVIESQTAEIEILIRKKETLRDEITEKDAEIERLRKENERFADIGKMYSEIRAEAKSEAYREFAERLKEISKEVTVPYVADTSTAT